MSVLVLFRQVTFDDVVTQADHDGLDFEIFLERVKPLLEETVRGVGEDDEANLVRCLVELGREQLEDAGVDEGWLALRDEVQVDSLLVHPARTGVRDEVKKGRRYARLVMPLARTLECRLVRKPWNGTTMPSETIGAGTSLNDLVDDIAEKILETPGGAAYLGTNRVERTLGVLATSLAALLRDADYCQRTKRTGQRPLVRADMYEVAVRSMGLERHFQIVRRLLEVDHEEHLPHQVAWPTPLDPIRALGFLRERGDHLMLGHLPPFQWL